MRGICRELAHAATPTTWPWPPQVVDHGVVDTSDEAAGRVDLWGFDVYSSGLSGPGTTWENLRPPHADIRQEAAWLNSLPVDGWRELSVRSAEGAATTRMFAAPAPDGWFVALLSDNGIMSYSGEPVRPRPSKAVRSAGLVLAWLDGPVRTLADLRVQLINTKKEPWEADPDDSGVAHGHVLGDTRSGWFGYRPLSQSLRDLEPGEALELSVDFGAITEPSKPGPVEVQATLLALDLQTGPRWIDF